MPEPPRTAVQPGDVVAVRDAFDEWHPAIAESGVIRRGVSFPLVRCALPLREYAVVPFPVEDVLLLADTTLSRARTLRQAVDEAPQPGAVPQVPFEALRHGERVLVTAVLERTAVYGAEREKALDRLEAFELLEEPGWFQPRDPAAASRRQGREMASFGKRARPPRRATEGHDESGWTLTRRTRDQRVGVLRFRDGRVCPPHRRRRRQGVSPGA